MPRTWPFSSLSTLEHRWSHSWCQPILSRRLPRMFGIHPHVVYKARGSFCSVRFVLRGGLCVVRCAICVCRWSPFLVHCPLMPVSTYLVIKWIAQSLCVRTKQGLPCAIGSWCLVHVRRSKHVTCGNRLAQNLPLFFRSFFAQVILVVTWPF